MRKFLLFIFTCTLPLLSNGESLKLIDSLETDINRLLQFKLDSNYQIWLNYYELVDQYETHNLPSKAVDAFENSLKYAPNDTFKFRSYYRRLVWFSEQHNAEKAISLASKMLEDLTNYNRAKSSAYLFIAIAHEHKKDSKTAIDYYKKSMQAANENLDSADYYMIMLNMANSIFDSGDKDKALELYKLGVQYYKSKKGNEARISSILNNIGTAYMGIASDSVLKYLMEAKNYSKNLSDPWENSLASLNLGVEYFTIGQPELAKKELQTALKRFNSINEIYYHYEIYRILAALEAYHQNWNSSMGLLDSAKYYSNLVNNETRNEKFAQAKAEFGLVEEELKNKLLLIENKQAKTTIRWQKSTLVLALTLFLAAIAFVIYLKKQGKIIKNLNRDLKLNNDELDILITDKDNLMGILFHDIRSPMAAIKTVADFVELDDESKIDPNTMELLQEMKKVSEQGLKLVDNIWAIYELENKALDLVKLPVNINEIFEELEIEFEGMSLVKGIKFQVKSIDAETKTHKHLLVSVLRNLISNAFKFSPSGSSVTLSAQENENSIEIKITDEGPGFSKEDQQKMFQKFQKLSAQPLHGEKSSGLGLYLVTLIANKIGANIKLNKNYTAGAEFIFSIPK